MTGKFIIQNLLGLVASVFTVASSFRRAKDKKLALQTLDAFFHSLSDLVAGGYTGVLANFFRTLRNWLRASKMNAWIIWFWPFFSSEFPSP